jgi:hypothetical protein
MIDSKSPKSYFSLRLRLGLGFHRVCVLVFLVFRPRELAHLGLETLHAALDVFDAGLGLRVERLGYGVWGLGFGVWG